jgi:haloalkane dehalogenase
MLIPTRPENPEAHPNAEAWEALRAWEKPFVTLWCDAHPVVGGADRFWREGVPGAAGRDHVAVEEASFYLVEDRPDLVTEAVVGLFSA